MLLYTSPAIPIHFRPLSLIPHGPHQHPLGTLFCRPPRGLGTSRRPAGADPAALGLLRAAGRQMAGPPTGGDSRALERRSVVSRPLASRPRWRHGQDLRKPQIQSAGGTPVVRQRAQRAADGGTAEVRMGAVPRPIGSTDTNATLQLHTLLFSPRDQSILRQRRDLPGLLDLPHGI